MLHGQCISKVYITFRALREKWNREQQGQGAETNRNTKEETQQMPRQCSICSSPHRHEIESKLAVGASMRSIAEQFKVGASSVLRHAREHLPANLLQRLHANQQASQGKEPAHENAGSQGPQTLLDVVDIPRDMKQTLAMLDRYIDLAVAPMFPEVADDEEARQKPATLEGVPWKDVLRAVDRKLRIEEIILRSSGEIQDAAPVTNIMLTSPFMQIKALLVKLALEYPETKPVILEAIRGLQADGEQEVARLEAMQEMPRLTRGSNGLPDYPGSKNGRNN